MTAGSIRSAWFKQGPVYHIFPASFHDSNGDGVGDLKGVQSKLEYIASLGAKIVRLGPIFDSPQVDMGYDVSDYSTVYRPYGTKEDMENLIRATHGLGMRLILDTPISHTSDQHAWFKESRLSKDNPKRNWYIWRPAKVSPQGERLPPNNWRSHLSDESAWEWDEDTQEYYLRLYSKGQPDLNWDCLDVRKAIYDTAFLPWLEAGANGFVVDLANLHNKPDDCKDAPITNPGSAYQTVSNIMANETSVSQYLDEINNILLEYGAIVVGYLPSVPGKDKDAQLASAARLQVSIQTDAAHVGIDTTCRFDDLPEAFSLPKFTEAVGRIQDLVNNGQGWPTIFLESQDLPRSVSRFIGTAATDHVLGAKMLAMMQSCLSGTLSIYQGQELGLLNAPLETWTLDNYVDIEARHYINKMQLQHDNSPGQTENTLRSLQRMSRDHARIPMAWNAKLNNCGFSSISGNPPWMEMHPLAATMNMRAQFHHERSVYNFWRRMFWIRNEHKDLLVYGAYKNMCPDHEGLFMFTKTSMDGRSRSLTVINTTAGERQWKTPGNAALGLPVYAIVDLKPLISTHWTPLARFCHGEGVPLSSYEGRIYLVETK
ncbi:family 13 glycoside hydrolase [Stachybotrys elegans]|uniref:Family 13 glycoside hydrolase n=1 Tax=Stachybotrys elegans TaxID=80388 RepID=A0A8K0WLG1_9HYPO|nr:family 13 glycoside hydrolase [Stachybotrys elegans]